MGRPGQRHHLGARHEHQTRRDPTRSDGGRGLQVRHHRRDARDRLPRRETSHRQRWRPHPLTDLDANNVRHPGQTRHRYQRQRSLQPRRRPTSTSGPRRTRNRSDKSPPGKTFHPNPDPTTPTAKPSNASANYTKLCWGPPALLRSTLRPSAYACQHAARARLSARSSLRPRLSARFGLRASLSASRLGAAWQARYPPSLRSGSLCAEG